MTTAVRPVPVGTMLAIVQDSYGADGVLRLDDVRRPAPGEGEVLVRVHAAGVDRGTWHIMAGLPYPIRLAGFGVRRPKHLNPGRSLAGTVEAVGTGVTGLAHGDAVYGTAPGAFAPYVVATPALLARMPRGMSYDEAAGMPVSAVTALQAVRDHGRVEPGMRVLVVGASGGVGSYAVQIAKAYGADVTGVSGPAKTALVSALGADRVLDYTRDDVLDGATRYDVILDIGGNSRLSRLRRALAPKGTLVIVGGETDGRLLGGSDRQVRAMVLSRFVGQRLGTFVASENAADLDVLRGLVESGSVRTALDRTFALADTAEAVRHVATGQARGKVVVAVAG